MPVPRCPLHSCTSNYDCVHLPRAAAVQKQPEGHVVAVRITSEHAEDGFKPTCGHVDELHFRSTPEVWGYFAVKPGGQVHEFSDSQFGHVFAKGATRAAAIWSMVVALKEVKIRGEIRTLLDYGDRDAAGARLRRKPGSTRVGWTGASRRASASSGRRGTCASSQARCTSRCRSSAPTPPRYAHFAALHVPCEAACPSPDRPPAAALGSELKCGTAAQLR